MPSACLVVRVRWVSPGLITGSCAMPATLDPRATCLAPSSPAEAMDMSRAAVALIGASLPSPSSLPSLAGALAADEETARGGGAGASEGAGA
jgi:hypothetical protein